MEMNKMKPRVSVCVVTYNQENYIRQCLQSIVDQKTNFDFEVIVSDDCSTDKTRLIIAEFINSYSFVRASFKENNIGAYQNFIQTHDMASCEYVCHMDGDDYWLPGKLQHQVDILDGNNSIVQCWTCANVVDEDSNIIKIFPSKLRYFYPTYLRSEDIVLSYALVGQHSTQMYRRSVRDKKLIIGNVLDFYIAFVNSLSGTSYYSKKIYSAYRVGVNESITRNSDGKRVTVDLLSEHLYAISINHPKYLKFAMANLTVRRFFSLCAGHDLGKIDAIRNKLAICLRVDLICRSAFYFLLQKI